jgi:RND family efflux transporter MFP subunit
MMIHAVLSRRSTLVLGLFLGLAGCGAPPGGPPPPGAPHVEISQVVEKDVTDYVDFTARTSAVDSVDVKPRVFGYLDKVLVKEGSLVKKDDVLYEIDARPYQALLDSAEATVAQNEASLELARDNYQRFRLLAKTEPGAVTAQSLNEYQSKEAQAIAAVRIANASRDTAKLNVEWTKVRSPIDGRVSRTQVTRGNLVQSGEQSTSYLISVVSVDPVYALFDVDEGTFLRVSTLIREGKIKKESDITKIPVLLGLANEDGFPHRGKLNFVDNQVNQKTGTMRMRGVFANKDESLVPGLFARVRVPIGGPHKALLVTDRAVGADQGQKVVFVVNDKNEVTARPVKLGALHDGLRVVEEGLKAGEHVVVTGVVQVRSGVTVEPKLVDMPVTALRKPAR